MLFDNQFLRAKGEAFQSLFENLMGRRYPDDFMACRPWGNDGDRKNDGYLKSKRTLYQVYAPNEMNKAKALKKIREDFDGAKAHWKEHFDRWVFVHNDHEGKLPPHVLELLLELDKEAEGPAVSSMGIHEFHLELEGLGLDALESWLGMAPTAEDNQRVGFAELEIVFEHIRDHASASPRPTKPVPQGKIEYNLLSSISADWLIIGMAKAPLVEDFFSRWRDPNLGNAIAESFRNRYESLRNQQPILTPDSILGELMAWAEGGKSCPKVKMAALAVIAYYFAACEIFEEPPAQFVIDVRDTIHDPT